MKLEFPTFCEGCEYSGEISSDSAIAGTFVEENENGAEVVYGFDSRLRFSKGMTNLDTPDAQAFRTRIHDCISRCTGVGGCLLRQVGIDLLPEPDKTQRKDIIEYLVNTREGVLAYGQMHFDTSEE